MLYVRNGLRSRMHHRSASIQEQIVTIGVVLSNHKWQFKSRRSADSLVLHLLLWRAAFWVGNPPEGFMMKAVLTQDHKTVHWQSIRRMCCSWL